ncbi:MAG TPA: cob(I)yrinic acid a,c-diamide adenosyltransferase [Candidatus Nanoarchaeia archaeon]|nr:cob(I)yrinic acid a,c-diamide adenosyltransferase [Candidatus Nanoarchaeia archaeon]
MPSITCVTTRTGDQGETSLANGCRILKNAPYLQSIGDVDELNAALGLVLSFKPAPDLIEALQTIQNTLFHVGSEIAQASGPKIEQHQVDSLEDLDESLLRQLPPLENFILPGGSPCSAQLQLIRAICRRAERSLVALSQLVTLNPFVLTYINRLSDTLFILGRYQNQKDGFTEKYWNSRA